MGLEEDKFYRLSNLSRALYLGETRLEISHDSEGGDKHVFLTRDKQGKARVYACYDFYLDGTDVRPTALTRLRLSPEERDLANELAAQRIPSG